MYTKTITCPDEIDLALAVIENTSTSVLVLNVQGEIISVNNALEKTLMTPRELIVGRGLAAVIPAMTNLQLSPLPAGHSKPINFEISLHNGHTLPIELKLSSTLINNNPYVIAEIEDISERNNLIAALRSQTEKQRLVLSNMKKTSIYHKEADGSFLWINETQLDLLKHINPTWFQATDKELDGLIATPAIAHEVFEYIDDIRVFRTGLKESFITKLNENSEKQNALVRLWRIKKNGYIGLSDADFFTQSFAQETAENELAITKTGVALENKREEIVDYKGRFLRWVLANKQPIYSDGELTGIIGTSLDITDQVIAEEKYIEMATLNTLTKLPKKELFFEQLKKDISSCSRNASYLGVMYLDLDHFKTVNDYIGHAAGGDKVLVQFTKQIQPLLREHDTLCRLHGDEFAISLPHLKSPEEAIVVAKRILDSLLHNPIEIESKKLGKTIRLGVSIGIKIQNNTVRKELPDPDELLQDADDALQEAKQNGRNRYQVSQISL